MKIIKIKVCQGVGDIFWVYQKLAPYFDAIDFSIAQVPNSPGKIGTRAVEFLKLFPKTGEITTYEDTHKHYDFVYKNCYPLDKLMKDYDSGIREFHYACNVPLENGIRIEDIDPGYLVETNIDLKSEHIDTSFRNGEYITLYTSGTTTNEEVKKRLNLWDDLQWSRFVNLVCERYNLKDAPILFIGASYDKEFSIMVENNLKSIGYKTNMIIDSSPANVIHILKNSKLFIGYQSGLNILADNLDVKQIMLYFPYLKPMLNTWCKKENLENGVFNADTFNRSPGVVAKNLKLSF